MVTVANIRTTKIGEYVGRAMPRQRLAGSPLGNPYKLAPGIDRSDPIEQYRKWLQECLRIYPHGSQAGEIERLTELARQGDLVLLCWCAPLSCHADVIKELIERAV